MEKTGGRSGRLLICVSVLVVASFTEIVSCSRELNTCEGLDCDGAAGAAGGRDAAAGGTSAVGRDGAVDVSTVDGGGGVGASPVHIPNEAGDGRLEASALDGTPDEHDAIVDAGNDAGADARACDPNGAFGEARWPGLAFAPDAYNDEGFALSEDELTAYFASTRNLDTRYDIFFAKRTSLSATFDYASPLDGPVNTSETERQPASSLDGLRLFYTDEHDIFVAGRGTPQAQFGLGYPIENVDTSDQETEPFLASDGRTLYFVSDRNGPTRRDIFVSVMDLGGRFSTPREILSDADEKGAPVLTYDQLTMYYNINANESTIRVTHRRDTRGDFGTGDPVSVDPDSKDTKWPEAISADGCTLYFVEVQGGFKRLMMATRAK